MTPEEMLRQMDAENRKALIAAGGVPSDVIMQLLNEASLRGFMVGSRFVIATMQGAIAVKQAAA